MCTIHLITWRGARGLQLFAFFLLFCCVLSEESQETKQNQKQNKTENKTKPKQNQKQNETENETKQHNAKPKNTQESSRAILNETMKHGLYLKYWTNNFAETQYVFGNFAQSFLKCHFSMLIKSLNRLMCVFKELFGLSHLKWKNPNLPKLSMFLEILHNFFYKCHYSMVINSHNRLMCIFKEFFIVFWTHKISRVTRVCT